MLYEIHMLKNYPPVTFWEFEGRASVPSYSLPDWSELRKSQETSDDPRYPIFHTAL